MSIAIFRAWTPTSEEWDDAWERCPYSTYFQSYEWHEVWSTYRQAKNSPVPIALQLTNGLRVIFPLMRERILRGLCNRYISSPAGTFGGWLADRHLSDAEQSLVFDYIWSKFKTLTWRLNPYESFSAKVPKRNVLKDETHSLNLSGGFEKIYKGWTKGHASASRKARKAGVSIRIAETESDWEAYYQAYIDSHKRWGDKATGFYAWGLFKALFERRSSNIRLWLACYGNEIIAGAICFYSPTTVIYWHGAALSSYFEVRPVNLLIYEVIKHSAENGYGWFDFNPSGGLEGVKQFKRSFGAVALPSDVVQKNSLFVKIAQASYSRARKICRC